MAAHDEFLTRYSRHCLLPELGFDGQQRLLDSRVVIMGVGGLGSAAAMYLAASGVGHLTLCDFDTVDISNLQRQIIHRTRDVGRAKVASATDTIKELNPSIEVEPLPHALNEPQLQALFRTAHAVVDATDNFATRYTINRTARATQTPVISGAAIRYEGQVAVFDSRYADSPCYQCLYPDIAAEGETCSAAGVLAPLVGVIGSMQATEALKVLMNIGTPLRGMLWRYDALTSHTSLTRLTKDPACPECGQFASRNEPMTAPPIPRADAPIK